MRLPSRLSDYSVTEEDLDKLTKDAAASGSCAFNPRVPTEADIRALFEEIL